MSLSTQTRNLLETAAGAADCRRRRVAAVVEDADGKIVGVGWNGLTSGSCGSGECPRGLLSYEELPARSSYNGNCTALHAEDSALRAAGTRAAGGTVYVTATPCPECEVLLEDYQVSRVVVVDLHENSKA